MKRPLRGCRIREKGENYNLKKERRNIDFIFCPGYCSGNEGASGKGLFCF